jgi:hypothetical protein
VKIKLLTLVLVALVTVTCVIVWAPQAPAYPAYHDAPLTKYERPAPADEAPTSIDASIRKTRMAFTQLPAEKPAI